MDGATTAQALLGRSFRVTEMRGRPVDSPLAPVVMATVHPSSILRSRDDRSRHAAYAGFVADLRSLSAHVATASSLPVPGDGNHRGEEPPTD